MNRYICIYIYVQYVHNSGVHGRLPTRFKKGNGPLGKQAMEVSRLVNGDKNDADTKSKVKNTGYTRDLHGQ